MNKVCLYYNSNYGNCKIIESFGHNLDINSLSSDKEEADLLSATCNNFAKNKQKQTSWSVSVL
jgi:hypothetical protein